ncbi:MAG: hypothetical protein II825_04410 [Paludibacteraceae bacterium]|nr:hypothetical protein [Paludibacteraceae bacterium]
MKTVKLLTLCFCLLLGIYSAFPQSSNIDAMKAEIEQITKEIAQLQQEVQTPENKKEIEELERYRKELSELLIARMMTPVVRENDKIKIEIDNVTKKYYAHKATMDDYLKFFGTLSDSYKIYAWEEFEEMVNNQHKLVNQYNSKMNDVINNLKQQVRDETKNQYTPNITHNNIKKRIDMPKNYFSQHISDKLLKEKNIVLSSETKQNIQKMYDMAESTYLEIEEKKKAAENERQRLESDLQTLLINCDVCREKYNKRFKK